MFGTSMKQVYKVLQRYFRISDILVFLWTHKNPPEHSHSKPRGHFLHHTEKFSIK